VANDETDLLQLLSDVLALGDELIWGTDPADGGAAPLIAILLNHGQDLLYIPGRTVNRASEGYRGDGKTDAKDAAVTRRRVRGRRPASGRRASRRGRRVSCAKSCRALLNWPTEMLSHTK
jgi:hypothetical protein